MKAIFVTTLFLTFGLGLHAQTVKGRVLRAGSDTAVANAIIYYGGSTAGTIADEDGRFELVAKAKQIPITVSCVGYISTTVYRQPEKELMVYLKPKPSDLHEVVIRADGMNRKDEVALFTREFIGTSTYAQSCTITNIDDVSLHYDKKKGELTAYCDKPIVIENKKLGYTITYYLDNFSYTYNDVRYAGDFIFKEYPLAAPAEQEKIIANREDAYIGSRMQFVRALWQGNFDKAGFTVYDQAAANGFYNQGARYSSISSGVALSPRDILVRDSLQNLYIHLPGTIYIYHKNNMRKVNALSATETYSYINQNGFYGAGIKWAGPMGSQRIGDLLPFEYQPPYTSVKAKLVKTKPDSSARSPLNADVVTKNTKDAANSKDFKLFKTIVLTKDNPVGAVVRKWSKPVAYKLYGSTGDKEMDKLITADIQHLFNTVAKASGLSVSPATADTAVNFFIFLNGNPAQYASILPADVKSYFSNNKDSPGYYTYGDDGFHEMVKFLHAENITDDPTKRFFELKYRMTEHILNGLGFFGNIRTYKGSIFDMDTAGGGATAIDKSFDDFVIKSLYNPAVKSGMTEDELDTALKNVR